MRPSLAERLSRARQQRDADHARRRLRTVQRRAGARVQIDGRELLDFSGNDYLGLAQHRDLIAALSNAAAEHGVGATAAHLVCGHHAEHAALEAEIADWLGTERALLFGSGYLANLGVMQALLGNGDLCVQDRLDHACLIDGARLSGCELRRYPHADAGAAARQLAARPDALAMIATDGVFSMDGDVAPLPALAALAREQDALLYVDDAHGVGVIGPGGRGSVAQAGLSQADVPLQLVTLGKALGAYGAVVAGRDDLIEALLQTARPYLFTTALPPALAAASRAAVRLAREQTWRRHKLAALIARFRRGAHQLGLPLMDSTTPIQPLMIGGNRAALDAQRALEERGVLAIAIRPPTVPEGRARLRLTLTAAHEEREIDQLLDALAATPALHDSHAVRETAP